ncbi:MAG: hypothetical protein MI673_04270 [Thiotrichales bacterium]|nr:hypothetical protein [Thiotrichales bacterium]
MPGYCYLCEANQTIVVVYHDVDTRLNNWGEVCYTRQMPLGDTDPAEPVKKLITAPAIITRSGNAELKNLGFTKLIRRDAGVYENVTALDHESRYMIAGDASTLPDIGKKVTD